MSKDPAVAIVKWVNRRRWASVVFYGFAALGALVIAVWVIEFARVLAGVA